MAEKGLKAGQLDCRGCPITQLQRLDINFFLLIYINLLRSVIIIIIEKISRPIFAY